MNELILSLTQAGYSLSFHPDYDIKENHVRISLKKGGKKVYTNKRFPIEAPFSLEGIIASLIAKFDRLHG